MMPSKNWHRQRRYDGDRPSPQRENAVQPPVPSQEADAKKKKNFGAGGARGFESRSMASFMRAQERGEAEHLFPVDPAKVRTGEIPLKDVPYMQRGGSWTNSDLTGKGKGWMNTGFGMYAFNDGKAKTAKANKFDKMYNPGSKRDGFSVGIFGEAGALDWTGRGARSGGGADFGRRSARRAGSVLCPPRRPRARRKTASRRTCRCGATPAPWTRRSSSRTGGAAAARPRSTWPRRSSRRRNSSASSRFVARLFPRRHYCVRLSGAVPLGSHHSLGRKTASRRTSPRDAGAADAKITTARRVDGAFPPSTRRRRREHKRRRRATQSRISAPASNAGVQADGSGATSSPFSSSSSTK